MFLATTTLYSLPRVVMYFFSLCRSMPYSRLTLYFRVRITTFFTLAITLATIFVCVAINADELSKVYESTITMVIVEAGGIALVWLGVDLYWSAAIKIYKDSKRGKQGHHAAETLSSTIDPNNFLLNNETHFNTKMNN